MTLAWNRRFLFVALFVVAVGAQSLQLPLEYVSIVRLISAVHLRNWAVPVESLQVLKGNFIHYPCHAPLPAFFVNIPADLSPKQPRLQRGPKRGPNGWKTRHVIAH